MVKDKIKLESEKENSIKVLILYYIFTKKFQKRIKQKKCEKIKGYYFIIAHNWMDKLKDIYNYEELSKDIKKIYEPEKYLNEENIFLRLNKSYLKKIKEIDLSDSSWNKVDIKPKLIKTEDNENAIKYPHKFEIIDSKIFNKLKSSKEKSSLSLTKICLELIEEKITILYENKNLNLNNILIGNIDFSSNEFIPKNILNFFSSDLMINHFLFLKMNGWEIYLGKKTNQKQIIIEKIKNTNKKIGKIYYLNKEEEIQELNFEIQNKENKEKEGEEDQGGDIEFEPNIINIEEYIQIEGINKNHLKLLFGIKFFQQKLKEKINNNIISIKKKCSLINKNFVDKLEQFYLFHYFKEIEKEEYFQTIIKNFPNFPLIKQENMDIFLDELISKLPVEYIKIINKKNINEFITDIDNNEIYKKEPIQLNQLSLFYFENCIIMNEELEKLLYDRWRLKTDIHYIYIGNKILLIFNNNINIGYIDENNIFIPECIIKYFNEEDYNKIIDLIQKLGYDEFKEEFNEKSEQPNYFIAKFLDSNNNDTSKRMMQNYI